MSKAAEGFGARLRQAVDGHPLAPRNQFGRQKWLLDKLAKEAKLNVSPNTVHKWFGGLSRPREDNINSIATVLSVDEVWLALGRRPVTEADVVAEGAGKSNAATMILAGVIEMHGGKVNFPHSDQDEGVSLWADLGTGRIGFTVVTGREMGSTISYIVPEPTGTNRVVAVRVREMPPETGSVGCLELIDLTGVKRQNFGGFSVIKAEVRPGGRIKVDGQRNLLSPLSDVERLTAA